MKEKSKILILLSLLLLSGCTSTNSSSGEISSIYVPQEHEMVELRSLLTTDINNKSESDALGVNLGKDENVWLKYTATFDSVYCFTIVDYYEGYHFSAAWDIDKELIADFDVNEVNGNKVVNGSRSFFYGFYDLYLTNGTSVFFNVRNFSENSIFLSLYFVSLTDSQGVIQTLPDGIERHTHTYGFSFEQYDDKQHKSFCWKDEEYVLEDHHFDSEGVCSDCGYKK